MTAFYWLGIWGAITAAVFAATATLAYVEVRERRTWARLALASPLWPLVLPLALAAVARWAMGGKS